MFLRHKKIGLFCFLVLMVLCGVAFGDGKFFGEKVPVGVPYQRAVILFEDGKEMLIVQSKYETDEGGDANSIAWVVPVPDVPDLASMDAVQAWFKFYQLGMRSRPGVVPITKIIIFIIVMVAVCILIENIWNRVFAKQIEAGEKFWVLRGLRFVVFLIVIMLASMILMPTLGVKGVDVIKAETVGVYDVKVIKGDDGGGVVEWLKGNGFGFDEMDVQVFSEYVSKGWCFVTAKINKGVDLDTGRAVSEGLASPLILTFDSKEAVYPMALTGTAGDDTEVLLYVLSDHKMECGEKLRLTYYGETSNPFAQRETLEAKPDDSFHDAKKLWQMSKFKGTLNPGQMKEDIVFKKAEDNEPYREVIWR